MELIFNLEDKTIFITPGVEVSLKTLFNTVHDIDPDNADQWDVVSEFDEYEDEDEDENFPFFGIPLNKCCSNENCICKRQASPEVYVVSTTLIG